MHETSPAAKLNQLADTKAQTLDSTLEIYCRKMSQAYTSVTTSADVVYSWFCVFHKRVAQVYYMTVIVEKLKYCAKI